MSLTEQINADIKTAMLAREKDKLDALRAVKSAILLLATDKGADGQVSDDVVIKAMQKLSKQRKEAADIFVQQGRQDLADVEIFQAGIIDQYLPKQMDEAELKAAISAIIAEVGAAGPGDIGKVMGRATKDLSGKADGKMISAVAKALLG